MICMSQNFRLFHVSNLSVRNFRIFLLMYPGLVLVLTPPSHCQFAWHSGTGSLRVNRRKAADKPRVSTSYLWGGRCAMRRSFCPQEPPPATAPVTRCWWRCETAEVTNDSSAMPPLAGVGMALPLSCQGRTAVKRSGM